MGVHSSLRGVTLIELVVVIVILSIGVGGLMQAYGFIMKSGTTLEESDLQKATNLAQSCALAILGRKRTVPAEFADFSGFTCVKATNVCTGMTPSLTGTACNAVVVADPEGYTLATVAFHVLASGTSDRRGCPDDLECLVVDITAQGQDPSVSTSKTSILMTKYGS
jgi:prepilin-type N-terminal cleavage/methylation domain-containing protein